MQNFSVCVIARPDKILFKIAGRAHRLHEVSRFAREDGRWFYVDGDILG